MWAIIKAVLKRRKNNIIEVINDRINSNLRILLHKLSISIELLVSFM